MPLFSRNKTLEVQSFMLKFLNNNCAELESLVEGPRLDRRVNLSVVVLIIPVERGQPLVDQQFAAVTKCFSSAGVSVVLNEPTGLEDVIVGFRWECEMKFVLAKAKHLSPMGAGFYQLGLQLTRVVRPDEYTALDAVLV